LPDFGKLNLIYGWNYSGKTTLSRIFQAIEEGKLPDEYAQGSFSIELGDGNSFSSSNLENKAKVRVFNCKYVAANFRTEYSAPAMFILGKENAKSRMRLEQLRRRLDRVNKLFLNYSSQREQLRNMINTAGTSKARDVRHILGEPNFDRTRLNQLISEIRSNPANYTLSEDIVQSRIQTFRSGDQYAQLNIISSEPPDMITAVERVNGLLQQTPSNLAIERLRQNPGIENWVLEGMELHKDAAVCEFCGGTLSKERLRELGNHFSREYRNFANALNQTIEELQAYEFLPSIHDEMRIVPEGRTRFAATTKAISEWAKWASALRDSLVEVLRQKQTAIERKLVWSGDRSRIEEGREGLKQLNCIIKNHNQTVSEFEKARSNAKDSLERHYAAAHFTESGLAEKEVTVKKLGENAEHCSGVEDKIANRIRSIEETTRKSSIAAARLNALVKYLLADSEIEVESMGDSEFQFRRSGHAATNLSEGEKTALTFAYFLISLEAEEASISDTIIFVDDPVSSLDLNHIYALHALLVERLESAQQLFVSTHNMELFNLLKGQWLGRHGGNREDTRAYQIWRTVNDAGEATTELLDLPVLLRKYKSEYEFVFYQLQRFSISTNPSLHEAYTAPNLLRKFLEAYLGFRKPNIRSWSKKLDLLLDSPEACREVQQFADDASHLQNLGRSLQHAAFIPNARRCVSLVLDGLKDKDYEHYKSLCKIATAEDS
jgi:wobble nucleotide-excising tRNase